MVRRLAQYREITGELGAQPTWPATACVLDRHPDLLKRYAADGVELAVHGLVHGDHALLDRARQRDSIGRALDVFERHDLRPTGFRGPYLRYNAATLDVLRELGFLWHSSQAILFPLVSGTLEPRRAAALEAALKLYSARDARRVAVTPRLIGGLVDIPVAVPDDEILLDRLGLNAEGRTAEWLHILEVTHRKGELFTVQLHPERIPELGDALGALLADARARKPAIHITRLDDIARWWVRRSHFALHVTRSGDRRYSVRLDADADATLLVRGIAVARTPWYGDDAVSEVHQFEADGPRIPVVSISRRSPAAVRTFLAEEGFATEISDQSEGYGAHIDVADRSWSEVDVLDMVAAAPGPIVRLWRWPNAARSALAVTGDIDALTLWDFGVRSWETRDWRAPNGEKQ
jgi:peptidoglycan/xylan/chitin deacetylase (PgdA/CDA1 family)